VERDFLLSMAERIHISRDEAERLVRASSRIDPADFDGTLQEARDLLHKLYLCAMADGVVVEAETKVLKAIALKSGVPGAEIDAMLGERAHLAEASGRAREMLRHVVELIEKTRSGEPLDASVSLPAAIEKLADCIAEIRAAVAKIPGGNVRDLPDWEMLRSARETIIKPHRRNMFLLKCAVLMTRADGELSDTERKFLYEMSDRARLPRSEADALIDSDPAGIQLSGFEGTAEEAKDLVHKLYLCALSDGVVHEEEKLLFERIVASLGVSQEEAMEPLMRDQLGPSATPLDVEAALRFLRSQEQLPRDTEFAEEMPAELLERIRGRFQMPEDEQVLLVYENRLMQQAIECAALTDRRLWIRTPRGRKEAIDVGMIKEFKAETGEATLVLTDGRTIGMTRTAVPFLKVLVPCVQECRRSA
jgi:DnaJ-domain-containing protein 1